MTMDSHKIFLPDHCLEHDTGLLIGWHDYTSHMTCVVGILHTPFDLQKIKKTVHKNEIHKEHRYSVVGLLHDEKSDDIQIKGLLEILNEQADCIFLTKKGHKLPICAFSCKKNGTTTEFMVITFQPTELLSSVHLTSNFDPNSKDSSSLDALMKGLVHFSHQCSGEHGPLDNLGVKYFLKSNQRSCRISSFTTTIFLKVAQVIDCLGKQMLNIGFSKLHMVSNVFRPAVSEQLIHRFKQIRSLTHEQPPNPKKKLRLSDISFRIFLDMLLGMLVFTLLLKMNAVPLINEVVIQLADKVVKHLQELLHWMMGFPAGLKLNSQLDNMLGRFFLYHIYLWTGYLNLLRPFLLDILWMISSVGCLGISLQVALMQDLISMMTLHIYCFYVYAARLYRIQVYTLAALWRLFRGKKWNVLRRRVDSATFDVDQLFVGTLLFTILLFLLPTTALYYIVFTMLRLFTLAIHGCLHLCVKIINTSPVYILILRIFNSKRLKDNMNFDVLPSKQRNILYLKLQLTSPSFVTLYKEYGDKNAEEGQSWGTLGKKLISGHLIYPWIEKEKEKIN